MLLQRFLTKGPWVLAEMPLEPPARHQLMPVDRPQPAFVQHVMPLSKKPENCTGDPLVFCGGLSRQSGNDTGKILPKLNEKQVELQNTFLKKLRIC